MSTFDFERLGRDAKKELSRQPDVTFDGLERRPAPRFGLGFAFATAAVLLVAGASWWWRSRSEPVPRGAWVDASSRPALDFDDGARVSLEPTARLLVEAADEVGSTVRVEGRVRFEVPHRRQTRWVVHAGPFRVDVVGTRFLVDWQAARGAFELSVTEGAVDVVDSTDGRSRRVQAGETFAAPPRPLPSTAVVDAGPAPLELEDAGVAEPLPFDAGSADEPPVMPRGERSSWQALARASRYDDAWARIERDGVVAGLKRLSASELVLLGDVARLTQHPGPAREAFELARRKAPKSVTAARAIFSIGVLDFPRPSSAIAFETYLREQPRGDFAAEALGRLIEVSLGQKDDAAARAAAQRYLERFPSGPHAALARSVLP